MKNIRWRKQYVSRTVTAADISLIIKPGSLVFIQSGAAEPGFLINAAIGDSSIPGISLLQGWSFSDSDSSLSFNSGFFFRGSNGKKSLNQASYNYIPAHLSELPSYFQSKIIDLDVALIQVSPPDGHGLMSLGVGVDITRAAVQSAKTVIAQVNQFMPRTHGDSFICVEDVDYFINQSEELMELPVLHPGKEIEEALGSEIFELIPSGATINVGYGQVPAGIVRKCYGLKDIGVHSTLVTNWLMELMLEGAITNNCKNINRGKAVASMAAGTRQFYDFLDDNPNIEMRCSDYVNSPEVISSHRNFFSIHGGVKMDLTGQLTCERNEPGYYGGVGGITDTARNAIRSTGGGSVVVMLSVNSSGESSIVPLTGDGVGIELKRQDIDWVITEFGIINMRGRSIRQRAFDLISIAHPDHRAELLNAALSKKYVDFSPGRTHLSHMNMRTTEINGRSMTIKTCSSADLPTIESFYYKMSESSKNFRFFSGESSISKHIKNLEETDDIHTVTLYPVGGRQLIAVGELSASSREEIGDFAIAVGENYRKMGYGKLILEKIRDLSLEFGLKTIRAEVLTGNYAMIRLLRSYPLKWNETDMGSSLIFTANIQ